MQDPATFSVRPPLVRWKLWAPGLALSAGLAFCLTALLSQWMANWGWALFIGVPLATGGILGYRFRARSYLAPLVCTGLLICIIVSLATLQLAGIFCGLILFGILSLPIAFGCIVGSVLRYELKRSGFSQASYLPIVVLAATPILWALLEGKHPALPIERVSTYQDVPATSEQCWNSIMFYEEVEHEPPLILRLGLAHPLRTIGSSRNVGDAKTCIYNKGQLTKQITASDAPRRLAFHVTEQRIGYERDVRLTGGDFVLEPIEGGTRITLTTVYQPLLAPRFCWRPAERIAIHLLHGHVLHGMKLKAESSTHAALLGAP